MTNEIKPIPNSPQELFCRSTVRELGFGGAAGPGKSFGLILDVLYQLSKKNYHAVIFRQTYKQLTDAGGLIDYSKQVYPSLGGILNQSTFTWIFPRYHNNTIQFSYIRPEASIEEQAGPAWAYIGFDQLESFTERQYLYLFSRNRSANPDINLYIRSTFNPGGIGHHWIKKRFIDPFRNYDKPKYFRRVGGVDTESTEDDPLAISRFFISARLEDNPYLWRDGNSEYERNLSQLDGVDFRRLRMGDWDIRRTGRVYHAFNDSSVGPASYDLDYSKAEGYWHAHDFGSVNRAWGLFVRLAGVYYLMHEEILPEGTSSTRAAKIKAHFANRKVIAGFGGAASEGQQRLDYGAAGVKIRELSITDVESQVDLTNKLFEKGTLKICSDMVLTIDQLENCIRDEKEGIQDKSTWHHLDVLRYFATGVSRSGVFVG